MDDHRTAKIRKIISAIRENSTFLVATHVRPDGDAIGALLGMRNILTRLGKKAEAFSHDSFPPEFEFLPGTGNLARLPAAQAAYDAAVLVDCGDFERAGSGLLEFIRDRVPVVINIDHHQSSSPFGTVYWVDTGASSTCEMLFDLCMHLSLVPDPDLAALLYTGILTDTGCFRFSNTNRRVLEIASILVESGADPAYLAEQIYDSASPEKLSLLTLVLETMEFHAGSRVATAVLTQNMLARTSTAYSDSEGFINHLRSVKTVDVAILFREGSEGQVHVSLRSKNGIDVAGFARRYGGGGHLQAAACRIAGELSAVRSRITREAISYIG